MSTFPESTETESVTTCWMCRHPVESHAVDAETGFRPCRSIGHSKGLNCVDCERLTSSEHVAAVMELRGADDPLLRAAFGAYLATRQHVEQEFGEAAMAFFTDVHESAVASALIEVRAAIEASVRESIADDFESGGRMTNAEIEEWRRLRDTDPDHERCLELWARFSARIARGEA